MKLDKTIDKITNVTSIVLGVLYFFLFIFSGLFYMVGEATIDATNPVYIAVIHISVYFSLANCIFCIGAIPISLIFKYKGRSLLSLIISLLPIMILLLSIMFLILSDYISPVL